MKQKIQDRIYELELFIKRYKDTKSEYVKGILRSKYAELDFLLSLLEVEK